MRERPVQHARVHASIGRNNRASFDADPSPPCPDPAGRLSQRADSIGVRVKLTSSDTMMANAIVRPKLFMNRPTMPPMKPTGTKMATSDSVVASTARPISRVAAMAASNGS